MNKKILGGAIIIIVAAGAFYAGSVYGKSGRPAGRAQFASGQFSGGMRPGRAGDSATAGQVLSSDATGITVKMQNGSTQIVLIGTSTPILKSIAGAKSDLTPGTDVVIAGTINSDGSLTAQSVQIRTAGMTGMSAGR